jgi:peptidoglycan DL-endopeptidase LytF
MSRRDTIIVAVLVNAGLLMVLFATATKSKSPKLSVESQLVQEMPIMTESPSEVRVATTLDDLLFEAESSLLAAEALPLEEESVLAAVEPARDQTKYVNVTVKQGDALEKIARANHTTIAAIVQANKLNSTQLTIGQLLKVPLSATAPVATKETAFPAEQYYVVKEGDNPWLLASKSHVKLEDLLKLNKLDEKTAKKLRPGDRLRIR